MSQDEAKKMGAMALFGEKYGDEVRVVSMGQEANGKTYSVELCGGTHVARTGDIGLVSIVAEGAVSAGVRRIEALTGMAARRHLNAERERLRGIAASLKVGVDDAPQRVVQIAEERRKLERDLAETRRRLAMGGGEAADAPETIGAIRYLGKQVEGIEIKDLKGLADQHKARIGSGVIALGVVGEDQRAGIVVAVTEDLAGKVNAVDLVRTASEVLGGKGGGGRPDMAQAGGPDGEKLADAFKAIAGRLAALG